MSETAHDDVIDGNHDDTTLYGASAAANGITSPHIIFIDSAPTTGHRRPQQSVVAALEMVVTVAGVHLRPGALERWAQANAVHKGDMLYAVRIDAQAVA